MVSLGGTEPFSTTSSLNKPFIVAMHFGYTGHLAGINEQKTWDVCEYKKTLIKIKLK